MIRTALILLLVTAIPLLPAPAGAREARPVDQWVSTCSTAEKIPLTLRHSLPGLLVVGAGPHSVELTVPPQRPFVEENGVGLSPVGEFAEWAKAPTELHQALAALIRCVESQGAPTLSGVSNPRSAPLSSAGGPWRLLLGLLLAGIATLPLMQRGRLHAADLLAVALVPLTLLYRLLLVPVAYLHQNGQGPLWVNYALGEASGYGPGFQQLYSPLLSRVTDPDGTLFLVHAVAGALIPFLVYAIARGVNAGRWVALAAALAAATSPAFARVAQSESYFAPIVVLLTAAGAVLALTATPESGWRRFLVGVAGAGFLVSQASLVHPIGWIPAALLPLCAFFVPAGPVARAGRVVAAGLGIALVVALTSGPALLAVLEGELGARWLSPGGSSLLDFDKIWLVLSAGVLVGGWLGPHYARSALPLALTVLTWGLIQAGGGVLLHTTPALRAAYVLMFTPVLAGTLAAAIAPLQSRQSALAAALTLVLAAGLHVRTWDSVLELPTDTLETKLALEWKALVPKQSRVTAVERAGRHVLTLPLRVPEYGRGAFRVSVDPEEVFSTPRLDHGTFYYRAALCSTEVARRQCEEIEATHRLERVWSATLPARPSISDLVYDRPEVEVVLFKVLGPAGTQETPDAAEESPPSAAIE